MKILVLNGSTRPNGNTAALVEAFVEGAEESDHEITVVPVCQKKIAGCPVNTAIPKERGDIRKEQADEKETTGNVSEKF